MSEPLSPDLILAPFTPKELEDRHRYEEHVQAWGDAWLQAQAGAFKLGAVADSLTRAYGEATVRRFASEVGVSTALIYERADTFRKISAGGGEIRPRLSYTHHQLAYRTPDPKSWLDRAEDEGLSTRQMEAEIRGKPYTPFEPGPFPLPTYEKSRRLESWLEHLRALPCLRCERRGMTEASHFKGVYSDKTGERETRRGVVGMWVALPLCSGCHRTDRDSLHNVSEAKFLEQFGGYEWAQAWVLAELVSWLERQE